MYKDINELVVDIRELQEQMETLFEETREQFRYTLEGKRVHFSREVEEFQRRFRVSSLRYIFSARISSVLTAPIIYSMVIPLFVIDLTFTLYQQICFRAYGIARVRRRDYLVNDRHKLVYLNNIEKINCSYCGYSNGVVAYVVKYFPAPSSTGARSVTHADCMVRIRAIRSFSIMVTQRPIRQASRRCARNWRCNNTPTGPTADATGEYRLASGSGRTYY